MIWADRVGLAWAVIVGGFFLAFAFQPGVNTDAAIPMAAGFVLAPWMALRLFDFVIGGPARRAATQR